MTQKIEVQFTVNGQATRVHDYPMARLLDVVRDHLRLTGSKEGCGEGECGACSVVMNGELTNSCLIPLVQAHGARVETVESVAHDPVHRRLVQALLERGAAQCGICTPGMLVAAAQLLTSHPRPTLEQVKEGLAGNLCRCTGYTKIYDAVMHAHEVR